MGVGEAQGEKAAYEALKNAIESPLLDDVSINGAMGVLVHFNLNPNYPLLEIQDAMQIIYESCDDEATIIMGTTASEDFPQDFVNITMIATGFEQKPIETKAPSTQKNPSVIIQRKQIDLENQQIRSVQQPQQQIKEQQPEPQLIQQPQPIQSIQEQPKSVNNSMQQQVENQSIQPKIINLDDQISAHQTTQQYNAPKQNNLYSINSNNSMKERKPLSNNDDYDIPTWLRRRDKNF